VLLFQMTTGVLPFDGQSMGEVLVKQVTALPPVPRAINPAIPPSVEQILLRCLAKRLDARFATMLQLREALLDPEAYLRGSPPIAPARSVGSGEGAVEAKTVMVQAAQLHKTRIATGAHALPLPAPAMSMAGQPSAPTMIADHGGHAPIRRATTGMPALAPSQEPKMNTMRIATPLGYSSRPPRKVWPVVLVMALLVGVGGGALVVARSGRGGGAAKPGGDVRAADGSDPTGPADPAATRTVGSPSPEAASRGTDTGHAGSNAAAADPGSRIGGNAANGGSTAAIAGPGTGAILATRRPIAHLLIDSVPAGAVVSGPDGEALGRTPLKVDWPISDLPVTFELRLAGYKKKQKQTVVNSNTALHIELERAPVIRHNGNAGGSARPGSGTNGLMRPE
jgi:hypothetical protein